MVDGIKILDDLAITVFCVGGLALLMPIDVLATWSGAKKAREKENRSASLTRFTAYGEWRQLDTDPTGEAQSNWTRRILYLLYRTAVMTICSVTLLQFAMLATYAIWNEWEESNTTEADVAKPSHDIFFSCLAVSLVGLLAQNMYWTIVLGLAVVSFLFYSLSAVLTLSQALHIALYIGSTSLLSVCLVCCCFKKLSESVVSTVVRCQESIAVSVAVGLAAAYEKYGPVDLFTDSHIIASVSGGGLALGLFQIALIEAGVYTWVWKRVCGCHTRDHIILDEFNEGGYSDDFRDGDEDADSDLEEMELG